MNVIHKTLDRLSIYSKDTEKAPRSKLGNCPCINPLPSNNSEISLDSYYQSPNGSESKVLISNPRAILQPNVSVPRPIYEPARMQYMFKAPPVPSSGSEDSQFGFSKTQSSSSLTFPQDLKDDISKFQIDGFAKKHFSKHKKGLFLRKLIPVETLISWTKSNLDSPLIVLGKSLHKPAVKCFKQIQKVMGDRPEDLDNKNNLSVVTNEEIQSILKVGLLHEELRDEIYVQLCKQLFANPSIRSCRLGWEIMCVLCITFPPSKVFENYLKEFLRKHSTASDSSVRKMALYAQKKLENIVISGPRSRCLSLIEINKAREAPFFNFVFGESLDDIMSHELKLDSNRKIPRILEFLSHSIIELGGERMEGIFRIPASLETVNRLKLALEKDEDYSTKNVIDPNVFASLLKLWLRELTEPLIPNQYYDYCIKHYDNVPKLLEMLEALPKHHQAVLKHLLQFLKKFSSPQNEKYTKMSLVNLAIIFVPDVLRCPSQNPQVLLGNASLEQKILHNLLLYYKQPKSNFKTNNSKFDFKINKSDFRPVPSPPKVTKLPLYYSATNSDSSLSSTPRSGLNHTSYLFSNKSETVLYKKIP